MLEHDEQDEGKGEALQTFYEVGLGTKTMIRESTNNE